MTKEEFWEKWEPTGCSEWGHWDDVAFCKKEMFDDLDAMEVEV